MLKRFIGWYRRTLTPLYWRQENFHHGRMLLAIWRWGRLSWEVWDFGPNAGDSDVEHVRDLLRTMPRRFFRDILIRRATLLLETRDFRAAKELV